MPTAKDIQKALEVSIARAKSRGFTREYQEQRESEDNIISHRNLAPATNEKYDGVKFIWNIWRLSRGEPEDDFSNLKDTPDPTPQQLKSFAEHYITSRDKLPSQQTACDRLFALTSMWERGSSRSLDLEVKRDVVNYICNDLTTKYQLRTEPRERFLVNAKDIDYLLHHLFDGDSHDFKHERARVQTGSSLSLFAGSGSRAGAIVESSSYRHSNECLYYRHLSFHIKWSEKDRRLMRWVTIDPKFLKGQRIRDDKVSPKNWFNEHPILGKSFVFWVIVHGVADGAFKDLDSVEKVLSMKPPKGRESWTLEWTEDAEKLPFFRAVTTDGPAASKALSFSSLHHNNTKLAVRDGFKDKLRVHGIRGGVANMIDPKASEATRGQALDHQNHNTFLKYQSPLKALDIQAVFYDLEPNYECRSMEQSMSHHRDVNVPQKLSAAAIAEFLEREDIIKINQKISSLNYKIDHRPEDHKDLALERAKLYDEKSKLLHNWKAEFVKKWWDASYTEYVAGNDFSERDTTRLFDICRKYMPERDRLSENLFEEATLDSLVGRQCLTDMVALCKSTERVAYYPGMLPEKGKCPICSRPISSILPQGRAKHILQCHRKSLNGPPYQQRYKNEKRAHRRAPRHFLQFCYLCVKFFSDQESWQAHCQNHLDNLQPRCGLLVFRSTLVAPGFCPICLGDRTKPSDERFTQWIKKATLLNHIDMHLKNIDPSNVVACPHPSCNNKQYKDTSHIRRHFHDVHSIEEPRSNCVNRKRKYQHESESTTSHSQSQSPEQLNDPMALSMDEYFPEERCSSRKRKHSDSES